jgi:P27 family predicted phage terminase small subunit
MPRGRRPDPDAVKRAKGNPGKRALTEPAALPSGADHVRPPGKMPQSALAVWKSIAPDLERMNFLRPTDAQAFARYCNDVVRYWDLAKALRMEGDTYKSTSVHGELQRLNPKFLIQDRIVRRLEASEDRFGLSPAARQAILRSLASQMPQLPFGPNQGAEPAEPEAASPIGMLRGTADAVH